MLTKEHDRHDNAAALAMQRRWWMRRDTRANWNAPPATRVATRDGDISGQGRRASLKRSRPDVWTKAPKSCCSWS